MKHSIIFITGLLLVSTIAANTSEIAPTQVSTTHQKIATTFGSTTKQACILLPYIYICKYRPTLKPLARNVMLSAELALLADIRPKKRTMALIGAAIGATTGTIEGITDSITIIESRLIKILPYASSEEIKNEAEDLVAKTIGNTIASIIIGTTYRAISGVSAGYMGLRIEKYASQLGNAVEKYTLDVLEKRNLSSQVIN